MLEPLEPRRLLAASTIRIDAGGGGFTESSGKVWQADRGFTAGAAASHVSGDLAGTDADGLFASRRFGNFSYSLPIANGAYRVKLLLVDPSFGGPGQRTFDVHAEKKLVLNDFDVAAAAGGSNKAITKSFNTAVADGKLNLWFTGVKENAIVSAIEVVRAATATPAITWKVHNPAPLPRFEAQGEVIGSKLYVLGGFQTADIKTTARSHVFDAATGLWSEAAPVPLPQTHGATATDGTRIYLAGGFVGDWKGTNTPASRKVYVYDTATNRWDALLPLPQPRGAGALVRVGRKLHFFGGLDKNFNDRGEHWSLDLRKPTIWRTEAPMPNPRNHLGAALVGTKVYAIGGQKKLDEEHGNVADVHAFDVVTRQWSQVAGLPQPRSHTHNSTFVISGARLVIVGGSGNDHKTFTDVNEYDPASNAWKLIGHTPGPRSAAVARLIGNHIIVTGGTTIADINPETDTWISV